MEMSNDKTITETLPVEYRGYTIQRNDSTYVHGDFMFYPTKDGIQHDADIDGEWQNYTGNCNWADEIQEAKDLIDDKLEEAKELIDEKQN